MPSESARATTAREAAFRVRAPNSSPRQVLLVPLDEGAAREVAAAAPRLGPRTRVMRYAEGGAGTSGMGPWLRDVEGRARGLVEAISAADLVVMVARAGEAAGAAAPIGEACRLRATTASGVVLDGGDAPPEALRRSLGGMRPHVGMLVVAQGMDYLEDMLSALRAGA